MFGSGLFGNYDVLAGIRKGGTFLLNSIWNAEETIRQLPDAVKKTLAEKEVHIINATKLARDIGLGNRTNTIMQSAFSNLQKSFLMKTHKNT